ncbi:MAG: 23S rRNA (adenine(2503)-C(2))-methyltransferase RlmN, partial [Burkholderiaceae bacterium]|nr:23S rRNA (adenine(2503)-C(2))-methyltransferase RlmN [Burkholderiaceae bacterium]
MNTARTNLLNFDAAKMAEYVAGLNEKPFRAKQLMQWVHQRGISDVALM